MRFSSFFTSLPSLPSVQNLLFHTSVMTSPQKLVSQFVRVRSTSTIPIFYRLLVIFYLFFWGVRVCSSSTQFERVRIPPFLLWMCLRTANKTGTGSELRGACPAFVPSNNEPPRINPHRLTAAGAIRYEFIPRCQRSTVVVRLWLQKSRRDIYRRMGFSPFQTMAVQAIVSLNQARQHRSDDGDFGFM